jgi:hypothetical protein
MPTPRELPPSLNALCANDDSLLAEELGVVAAKHQIAIVRTLTDELERCLMRRGAVSAIRAQIVHELARLGCRSLEIAAAMTDEPLDVEEASGVHLVSARALT